MDGYFGEFGGQFVAETLMPALQELETAYAVAMKDVDFARELERLFQSYAGRPSRLYAADRLSEAVGGAQILLKREDLNHTGSHKINHCLGHALLCQRMKKPRIIAETGAGQHGVATATVAALFGLKCTVYMGAEDVRRQALNVYRMQLLGAEVVPVNSGTRTLKDALNEALRDWVSHVGDTYYCLGSVTGPHPFPTIVREFQSAIGREVRAQLGGKLPDALVACVGGGSNALGLFAPFIADPSVRLIGVEAGGGGLLSGHHSASLCAGEVGILHGAKTLVLQNADGQIAEAHSLAPGLDYPGVGPEHAWLKTSGRAEYISATDDEAVEALELLAKHEGILCALESAHAVAGAVKAAHELGRGKLVVVNISGRGDKDAMALKERAEKRSAKAEEHSGGAARAEAGGVNAAVHGATQKPQMQPDARTTPTQQPASAPKQASKNAGQRAHRFADLFKTLRAQNKKALGAYFTIGDPDIATSEKAIRAALKAGADFIELGMPFSDPSADGPAIQHAMERALAHGTTLADALSLAERLRQDFPQTPLLLFGYANPFFRALQTPDFLARAAGVLDGLLVVDVPPEHGADFAELSTRLDWIRLLAPNATPQRQRVVAKAASGFIYLVAVTGITGGAEKRDVETLRTQVAALKALSDVPICVGFGVREEKDARELAGVADGIIVGSAFVEDIARGGDIEAAVAARTAGLRRGLAG